MVLSATDAKIQKEQLARLLSRGGRILGLAAAARARGQRPGKGSWYALSLQIRAPVEELLLVLDQDPDPRTLEVAVRAAMAARPSTAAPSWTEPLWRDPELLRRIGSAVDKQLVTPALGPAKGAADDLTCGLAALATAFCRSLDTLCALAERLPEPLGRTAVHMGYLAQVTARPGQPSRVRNGIRQLLNEVRQGG